MKKLSLISILFLIFASGGCADNKSAQSDQANELEDLPYYKERTFTPHWLESSSDSLKNFHSIRPFSLWDQNGNSFTDADLANKIYVVDFFFTTCGGICPKLMKNMKLLQNEFEGNDAFMLISHSVTPSRDSSAVLNAYAERNGIHYPQWRLLTGEREEIYDLGRNYYFIEENLGESKSMDDFLHTENFVLIDQNKHIRGIYNGLNATSISGLIQDIKQLLEN